MRYPKGIYVYVCDHDSDGTPIYAVARVLDELPEDCNGELVASYMLVSTNPLKVSRTILSSKKQ